MEGGVTMMGGDPDALYRLPRHQQAQVLGWYAATRLPDGWRKPTRPKRVRGAKVESESAERFWLGGD